MSLSYGKSLYVLSNILLAYFQYNLLNKSGKMSDPSVQPVSEEIKHQDFSRDFFFLIIYSILKTKHNALQLKPVPKHSCQIPAYSSSLRIIFSS